MKTQIINSQRTAKYFYIFLSIVSACIFDVQIVNSQSKSTGDTEGSWTATIKDDNKINIEFKMDDRPNSSNNSKFSLSDFSPLPKEQKGDFNLTREAGKVLFTGRFEGNEGFGRYKFIPDADYRESLSKQGVTLDAHNQFIFFHLNITNAYVRSFKDNGYQVTKNELIPLAALGVDEAYIRFWKENGYTDIKLSDLIPMKSLNITPGYVKGFADLGYSSIKASNLIPMKSLGITPEYVRSFHELGFKNIAISQFIPLKSLGVTAEYVKKFQDLGFTNFQLSEMISLKSIGVTPEYVSAMKKKGFDYKSLNKYMQLKNLED